MESLETKKDQITNRKAVFLIGKTEEGKTVIFNYLLDNKLTWSEDDRLLCQ